MDIRSSRIVLAILAVIPGALTAQSFNSTSTGADGPLNLVSPGVVNFDLHASENIYQFTTITIGPGVTVKLSGKSLHNPVYWLAQGDVRIDGTIDASGEDSVQNTAGSMQAPAGTGAGGRTDEGASEHGGLFTGNKLLIPLVGGSSGGGAAGGGGGGALLIASSTSITLNGNIRANGGNQADPGFQVTGGSGGAIRLVSPAITGSGALLTAKGGVASGGAFSGGNGYIRLEAYENTLHGDVNGTPLSIGKPFKLFLPPDPPPLVKVVASGNTPFSGTTLSLNQTTPVTLTLEARSISPGTIIKVHFYSDKGQDQIVDSTKLAGTFQLSHAIVAAPFSAGLTHVTVEVEWPLP